MALLRESAGPVGPEALAAAWPEDEQRARALAGLLTDGLVEQVPASPHRHAYQLPGHRSGTP